LANLFLIELAQGAFDNFNVVFQESIIQLNKNIPELQLTIEQVNGIRIYYSQLVKEWKQLEPNQAMKLSF
jgi:hypothetical protein